MKNLSKTAWFILGIGIFIIAMVGLFVVYRGDVSEQDKLNSRLTVAQNALPPLISQKEDLENQLDVLKSAVSEAESLLSEAKGVFPKSVESIEYDEILFGIADDWNLEVTSLTASEPSEQTVEDISFTTTTFIVDVEGTAPESAFDTEAEYETYIEETVSDILDFIHTITTSGHFNIATIEMITLRVPEPLPDEELVEEGIDIEKPAATVRLVNYGYKGE